MKVNVLGTEYEVITEVESNGNDVFSSSNVDGYFDSSTKKIFIAKMVKEVNSVEDLKKYEADVIRHELIHAFLYESGLDCCSWAENEEMVDWIALQFPKMNKAFNELEV